ncbi:hypothetical protein E2C01_075874 [Portunus trituberculatus]|uniref:Uncharacterized protein n=1 Tax=Portunus trituberculatus TaxID=210409 RepID=A0A5B7II80_PORTR|nr:hypothetical protein [Portunus trituberculatus]
MKMCLSRGNSMTREESLERFSYLASPPNICRPVCGRGRAAGGTGLAAGCGRPL